MSDVSTARLTELRTRWSAQLQERPGCPRGCAGAVSHDGTRERTATLGAAAERVFAEGVPQRRLSCGACGLGYLHHPEGITSRAHYQPCVVSRAIADLGTESSATTTSIAEEIGCVPSTVRRWVERVASLAEPAQLASALAEEAGEPVVPAVPTALVSPPRSVRLSGLLLRALTVLVLLEALASVRGYAPPALAHAARFIPAVAASPRNRGDPSLPA